MRSFHWFSKVKQFKKELPAIKPGAFVFVGDSITEAFEVDLFFPQFTTVNRGIGGDQIESLKRRLDISALLLKPSHLSLMIGINDIGNAKSTDYILQHYTDIMMALKTGLPDCIFYINSILPTGPGYSNCNPKQILETNNEIADLCIENEMMFVYLYTSFVNENGWLKPELTYDDLHLNRAGYELWASLLNQLLLAEKESPDNDR